MGADLPELDITDRSSVSNALATAGNVDLVINAAAYTAVDRAESERELAFAVNSRGAENLAQACLSQSTPLVHISTDYVFDGLCTRPYLPTDTVAPDGAYATSKAQAEQMVRQILPQHLIFRISWLFGRYGANFVKTMLRLGRENEVVRVVDDQIGSPTYAGDVAEMILQVSQKVLAGQNSWGTYHYCNKGAVTWYAFARKIFAFARAHESLTVREVVSILTAHYPTPAPRPHYSVLDCTSLEETFGISRRPWEAALKEMLAELYAA